LFPVTEAGVSDAVPVVSGAEKAAEDSVKAAGVVSEEIVTAGAGADEVTESDEAPLVMDSVEAVAGAEAEEEEPSADDVVVAGAGASADSDWVSVGAAADDWRRVLCD
jgi:hypothetical protein